MSPGGRGTFSAARDARWRVSHYSGDATFPLLDAYVNDAGLSWPPERCSNALYGRPNAASAGLVTAPELSQGDPST